MAVARMFMNGKLSPRLHNMNFYVLAAEAEHEHHDLAWFPSLDEPKRVVAHMRDYVRSLPARAHPGADKPLEHYVLLAQPESSRFKESWLSLGELVSDAKPVVGFSPEEALLARRVTVAADTEAISDGILRALREAGCDVQRLPRPILDGVRSGTFP